MSGARTDAALLIARSGAGPSASTGAARRGRNGGVGWSRPRRRPGRAGPEAGSGGPGGRAPNGSMEHDGNGGGQRCRQVSARAANAGRSC